MDIAGETGSGLYVAHHQRTFDYCESFLLVLSYTPSSRHVRSPIIICEQRRPSRGCQHRSLLRSLVSRVHHVPNVAHAADDNGSAGASSRVSHSLVLFQLLLHVCVFIMCILTLGVTHTHDPRFNDYGMDHTRPYRPPQSRGTATSRCFNAAWDFKMPQAMGVMYTPNAVYYTLGVSASARQSTQRTNLVTFTDLGT